MIHGMDTGFLVSAELVEHPEHVADLVYQHQFLILGGRNGRNPKDVRHGLKLVNVYAPP